MVAVTLVQVLAAGATVAAGLVEALMVVGTLTLVQVVGVLVAAVLILEVLREALREEMLAVDLLVDSTMQHQRVTRRSFHHQALSAPRG